MRDPVYGAEIVKLEWRAGAGLRRAEIVNSVATRDRSVQLAAGERRPASLTSEERALYLKPTALIPTDGVVKETSDKIVAGAPTRHCEGAARSTLGSSRTPSASRRRAAAARGTSRRCWRPKSSAANAPTSTALFVGLARAAGLPARDLYGIRVAPSRFGYKSLGVGSTDVTKAQHCRADVWLEGIGWTPMDAADVRKVMLEEPPTNLSADDPKVVAAREALIGGLRRQLGRVQLRARRRVARRLRRRRSAFSCIRKARLAASGWIALIRRRSATASKRARSPFERSHPSPDRARPWRRLRLQTVARRVARAARRAARERPLRQSAGRHGDRRRRGGVAARRRDLHRRDHRLLHADGRRPVRLRPHRCDQRALRRLRDGRQAHLRARGPWHADQQHADQP